MRTIKFRGKRLDNNEWVYGYLADKSYINDIDTVDLSSIEVSLDTICEYAGLDDKNGKEIYEGDIVKAPLLDPIFGDVISDAFDNVAIAFYNGSFVVAYYQGRHKIYLQDLYDKIEVIGNIYDNPELLEGD